MGRPPPNPKPEWNIPDHPLRLRDHPGLVQAWESVCRGVLGTPLLDFFGFRDLSRFHHRKTSLLRKHLGGTDSFGPTQNPNLFDNRSISFKNMCDFGRIYSCFKSLEFPTFYFSIFRCPKFPRVHHRKIPLFMNTL